MLLTGSEGVAAGAFAAGTAHLADSNRGQISRLLWGTRAAYNSGYGLRRDLSSGFGNILDAVNQIFNCVENADNASLRMQVEYSPTANLHWVGNRYWLTPAALKWSLDPAAGPTLTMGWLYGAALVARDLPLDAEGVDTAGQRWIVWAPQNACGTSLILAIPGGYN